MATGCRLHGTNSMTATENINHVIMGLCALFIERNWYSEVYICRLEVGHTRSYVGNVPNSNPLSGCYSYEFQIPLSVHRKRLWLGTVRSPFLSLFESFAIPHNETSPKSCSLLKTESLIWMLISMDVLVACLECEARSFGA